MEREMSFPKYQPIIFLITSLFIFLYLLVFQGCGEKSPTESDNTAAAVQSTSPSSNETNVFVNRTINITFSEAMNKTSAQEALTIVPAVAGAFSWSGNTLKFTPTSPLTREITYTITINTTAKDLAGNALLQAYTWSFTTTTIKPAAPTDIKASISENRVRLTWKDNSDNEDGFRIEKRKIGEQLAVHDKVGLNITSYTITGLDPNTRYDVAVRAFNDYGVSSGAMTSITTKSVIDTLDVQKDATIYFWRWNTGSDVGNWNYENETNYNRIGTDNIAFNEYYYSIVMYFGDIRSLVSVKKRPVKSAQIEFHLIDNPNEGFPIFKAELNSRNWSESTITHENGPSYDKNSILTSNLQIFGNKAILPMTKSVQYVLDRTDQHGGFWLYSELSLPYRDRYYTLSTKEDSDPAKRPKLIIEFD